MKIFGRDPVWWTNLGGLVVVLLATLLPITSSAQGWINGAIAALVGLVVAAVTKDGIIAAAVGLLKAAIVVAGGYGVLPVIHTMTDTQQAALWAVLAAISAGYLRTQVTAPIDANGNKVIDGQVVPGSVAPAVLR